MSKRKAEFDAKLTGVGSYVTLHDLRRTARTLMSACGVRPDIAEEILGHAQGGVVEGIYDRHSNTATRRPMLLNALAGANRVHRQPQR